MGIASVSAHRESDDGSPHAASRRTTVAKLFSVLKPRRGKETTSYARSQPTDDSLSENEISEMVLQGGSDPNAKERSIESSTYQLIPTRGNIGTTPKRHGAKQKRLH